jgi:hypothetical protein
VVSGRNTGILEFMLCSLTEIYLCFGEICCLHFQGERVCSTGRIKEDIWPGGKLRVRERALGKRLDLGGGGWLRRWNMSGWRVVVRTYFRNVKGEMKWCIVKKSSGRADEEKMWGEINSGNDVRGEGGDKLMHGLGGRSRRRSSRVPNRSIRGVLWQSELLKL